MKALSSVKNPVVQEAKSLQTGKGRKAANAFLLDGEHMVSEALQVCAGNVKTVFVEETRAEDYQKWLDMVPDTTDCYLVPAHILEAISQVKTSQGIAAVCQMPSSAALEEMGNKLILLENVQDPGNVGTILRTLDAAGFDGCIFTPGCADPFGPKTLRATMGSLFRIPMHFAASTVETAKVLVQQGYAVIGAELHGDPFYERGPLPEKVCVMIGNEGQGLTAEALSCCTHRYKLPMRGGAESLNAAIAAAIFMYDIINH